MARAWRVAGICLFSALGSFLFGLDMGYIGPIIEDPEFMRDVAHLPHWDAPGAQIGGVTAGFIVSVFSLGCMFSAFPVVSSFFLDVLGRKASIVIGSAVFLAGGVIQSVAGSVLIMVAGRFVSGCSVGILSTVVPLYQSEVAPPELRGALTSLAQVMVVFGVAVATFADQLLLPLRGGWRWGVLMPVFPGVVLFFGAMLLLPRSPRWLVQQGRADDALLVLQSLRDKDDAEKELREIVADREAALVSGGVSWRELFNGRTLRLLLVGVALQLLQQLTGINAFVSYGPRIFQSLGISGTLFQTLCTLALFLATLPALYLVERFGRRSLFLVGAAGMLLPSVLMAILGLAFARQDGDSIQVPNQAAGGVIAACVFAFVVNFAYTWGPTTWVYCAEIFPMRVRGMCVGLTTMAEWAGVFLVNQFTPLLFSSLGFGAFLVFGAFSALALALCWRLPETRGVPLERMEEVFGAYLGGAAPSKNCDGSSSDSDGGNASDVSTAPGSV